MDMQTRRPTIYSYWL